MHKVQDWLPARSSRFRSCALVLGAGMLLLGCAAPIRLYPNKLLPDAEIARLRVSGAMSIMGAVKVVRVDDQWGTYGGLFGRYFNDKSTWGTKIDLLPGDHAIQIAFEEVPSLILKGTLAAGHTYGIEVAKGRPTCAQLLDSDGRTVSEGCYTPSDALSRCEGPKARIVFSEKEAKKGTGENVSVVLQSIDGIYGPNRSLGFYFFNQDGGWASAADLDVQVCPGDHLLVAGVRIPGWESLAPSEIRLTLLAGKTYRLQPMLGEPKKLGSGDELTLRQAALLVQEIAQ